MARKDLPNRKRKRGIEFAALQLQLSTSSETAELYRLKAVGINWNLDAVLAK